VVGIAAFVLATATVVLLVLLSQNGDSRQVTPLKEDVKQRSNGARDERSQSLDPVEPVVIAPDPSASRAVKQRARRRGRHHRRAGRRHELPVSRPASEPRNRKHIGPREIRSGGERSSPIVNAPQPPPQPAPAPAARQAPVELPAVLSPPVKTESESAPQKKAPDQPVEVKTKTFEIEIEDGDLDDDDLDDLRGFDGRIRLHVRSDQLLSIDIDGQGIVRHLMAGADTVLELDGLPGKRYELKFRRSKGVLSVSIRR
jgi:hypothetical protein